MMDFTEVYATYYIPILRYTKRLLESPEQAEDMTQEVFKRALVAYPRFQEETATVKVWLYCIATHAVYDELRRRRLKAHIPFPLIENMCDQDERTMIESPEEVFLRQEWNWQVHLALDSLPTHYHRALLLRYCEGYSLPEVARKIGYAEKGIKMLLKRARDTFVAQYQAIEEEEVAA